MFLHSKTVEDYSMLGTFKVSSYDQSYVDRDMSLSWLGAHNIYCGGEVPKTNHLP